MTDSWATAVPLLFSNICNYLSNCITKHLQTVESQRKKQQQFKTKPIKTMHRLSLGIVSVLYTILQRMNPNNHAGLNSVVKRVNNKRDKKNKQSNDCFS